MALSYKEAGVDKEQGYKEVGLIKKFIKETYTPGVLSDLGGFFRDYFPWNRRSFPILFWCPVQMVWAPRLYSRRSLIDIRPSGLTVWPCA